MDDLHSCLLGLRRSWSLLAWLLLCLLEINDETLAVVAELAMLTLYATPERSPSMSSC